MSIDIHDIRYVNIHGMVSIGILSIEILYILCWSEVVFSWSLAGFIKRNVQIHFIRKPFVEANLKIFGFLFTNRPNFFFGHF